jgi:hypothetical protein
MNGATIIRMPDGQERVVYDTEGVWEHPCGNQLFWLNDDGTINCGICNKTLAGFTWRKDRPS